MGSAYLLPRVIGLGRATELLMLGDTVDCRARAADRACDRGGRRRGAPGRRAASSPPGLPTGPALAYSTTKVLLTKELDMDLGGALELEAMTQALLMGSHDHAEYHRAWTEKRAPVWEGR